MPRSAPEFEAWAGVVYRATSYDVPLWVHPNRRDGRWNRAGTYCAQYCCLDAEAPFAELLRHEDLKTEASAAHYSTTIWQLKVDDGAIVNYSTLERAAAAGFPPEALLEDDLERSQDEAVWLMDRGAQGILSPSAALPGSLNLTLFGPRYPVAWATRVALASSVPSQRLTRGHPPAGLTARTRYAGQSHPLLVDYQARRSAEATGTQSGTQDDVTEEE